MNKKKLKRKLESFQCAQEFRQFKYDTLDYHTNNSATVWAMEGEISDYHYIMTSICHDSAALIDLLEIKFKPELADFVQAYNRINDTNLTFGEIFQLVIDIAPPEGLQEMKV